MITPTPTNISDDTTTQPPRWHERHRAMLIRIGSGVVGGILSAILIFAGNGLPFALGIALFSVWGANELYQAVKRQGGEPTEGLGYLACIVFQLAAWTHGGARFGPYLPAMLMILVIATLLAELGKHQPKPIVNVGTTILGAVYVGWLFSYLTLLHGLNPTAHLPAILRPPFHGTTQGEWLVIFVTVTTWLSDAGALFFGLGLGRHKMAPTISPAKTWEGSLGGVLTSLIGGALLGGWLHLPLGHTLGLAALCAVSGQIGDLSESALKRDLGVKDFGDVVPGHGGVLDRVDSLLFSAPLSYYYILFFLIRPH